MTDLKSWLRKAVRKYTSAVKIRGRHRLSKTLGALLSPDPAIELLTIDGFNIEIDHSLEFNRYIYYDVYEENFRELLKKILRKGDVFIDGGANIGYISAIASSLVGETGKVYAFEPSKRCCEILIRSNPQFKSNLHLFYAAISNKTGKALFNDTPRAISRGYACLDEVDHPEDSISYQVNTWSLDDFCSQFKINHIRFLKLDIEGAELLALQGSNKLLKEKKIDYILIETEIKENTRERQQQLLQYMTSLQYVPHRMLHNGVLVKHIPDLALNHTEDIIWVNAVPDNKFYDDEKEPMSSDEKILSAAETQNFVTPDSRGERSN